MPKVRRYKDPYEPIVSMIWGAMAANNMTVADLAARAKMGRSVIYRRKKDPSKFTVEELKTVGRALNIDPARMREVLPL